MRKARHSFRDERAEAGKLERDLTLHAKLNASNACLLKT